MQCLPLSHINKQIRRYFNHCTLRGSSLYVLLSYSIQSYPILSYPILFYLGLIRDGAADWHNSQHIAKAAERILSTAIVPNLIWRVRQCCKITSK